MRLSRDGFWVLASALCFVLVAPAALAVEDAAENCTGADLDGGDALPVVVLFTATTEDFTISDASCIPLPTGTTPDSVFCFRPTSTCSVNFSCAICADAQCENAAAGEVWMHIRALGGGVCTTAGGACTPGGAVTGNSVAASQSPVALTGGQNYCFICSVDAGAGTGNRRMAVSAAAGDCGPLPVELMRFKVED
jgi:hypothetical protein